MKHQPEPSAVLSQLAQRQQQQSSILPTAEPLGLSQTHAPQVPIPPGTVTQYFSTHSDKFSVQSVSSGKGVSNIENITSLPLINQKSLKLFATVDNYLTKGLWALMYNKQK